MIAYVALLLALAAPAFASNTFVCYDMIVQGYYQASTATVTTTSNGPFSSQLMLCPACLQASAVGSFVNTVTVSGTSTSTTYAHGGTLIACVSSCPSSSVTTATLSISSSGITWNNGITSPSATSTYVGQFFANNGYSAYSVALTNIECATP